MSEADSKINVGEIVTFSEEKAISKLKDLIIKLEKAESIDSVKSLITEFKTLIPVEQIQPVEAKKEEVKVVESVAKIEDVKAEPIKVEQAIAQEPIKATSLSDVLKLNDELIIQMKSANSQLETLEQINSKLKTEKIQLSDQLKLVSDELTLFKSQDLAEKQTKFNAKLDNVITNYCSFMGIPDSDKDKIKKEMSTFSEDMLDKTLSYIEEKKVSQFQDEPNPQTVPSADLKESEKKEVKKVSVYEIYRKIDTPQAKTDFIFESMVGNKPWENKQ